MNCLNHRVSAQVLLCRDRPRGWPTRPRHKFFHKCTGTRLPAIVCRRLHQDGPRSRSSRECHKLGVTGIMSCQKKYLPLATMVGKQCEGKAMRAAFQSEGEPVNHLPLSMVADRLSRGRLSSNNREILTHTRSARLAPN